MVEEGSFDASPVIGTDYTLAEGWLDHAPDDVKEAIGDSKYFENQKDLWGVIKSTIGLSKKVGEKIQLPTAESTDEEWDAHLAKIGTPGKDQEYAFDFKDLSDSQQAVIDEKEDMALLVGMLKEAGAPSRVAAKVVQSWLTKVAERNDTSDEALATRVAAQKDEWGDKATDNAKVVETASKTFLNDDQRTFLTESGMIDHPVFKSILLEIGNRIKTGRVLPGDPVTSGKGGEGGIAESLGVTAD